MHNVEKWWKTISKILQEPTQQDFWSIFGHLPIFYMKALISSWIKPRLLTQNVEKVLSLSILNFLEFYQIYCVA